MGKQFAVNASAGILDTDGELAAPVSIAGGDSALLGL